ncbi:hypothetical protein ACMDCR_12175 [Labrys okinawensis]|uniref:hypothetical protein n=1 Tax=Labrys okinawensis TaxID=346911 RepID=UPI0039BC9312
MGKFDQKGLIYWKTEVRRKAGTNNLTGKTYFSALTTRRVFCDYLDIASTSWFLAADEKGAVLPLIIGLTNSTALTLDSTGTPPHSCLFDNWVSQLHGTFHGLPLATTIFAFMSPT